jgi:hypothetical protein
MVAALQEELTAPRRTEMMRSLMKRLAVLICLGLIGCQSQPAPRSADENSPCPKVLEQSRAAGVDYVPTLRQAAQGDDQALSQLFRLSISDHMDADAQQCNIEALAELLRRLGDVRFAATLSDESADVRRAVVNGLILELDSRQTAQLSESAFAQDFPKTAETLSQ